MKRFITLTCLCAMVVCDAYAETLLWNGIVESNGTPTRPIDLRIGETYILRVSGKMNLGKWIKNEEKLANDACYEFSPSKAITKIETFKNSLGISVCDGSYHPNHIYESKPFKADQNRIHFWIYDTDYDDNTGVFHVQIFREDTEVSEETVTE